MEVLENGGTTSSFHCQVFSYTFFVYFSTLFDVSKVFGENALQSWRFKMCNHALSNKARYFLCRHLSIRKCQTVFGELQ